MFKIDDQKTPLELLSGMNTKKCMALLVSFHILTNSRLNTSILSPDLCEKYQSYLTWYQSLQNRDAQEIACLELLRGGFPLMLEEI